jgi:hypothetical protein
MEILAVPVAIIVFLFLFRVFVSVGGNSTPKIYKPRVDKWGNHLRALDMDQPDYMLNHDEEYKQYEEVEGETIVYDGEVVEQYQDRYFDRQLKSGRR